MSAAGARACGLSLSLEPVPDSGAEQSDRSELLPAAVGARELSAPVGTRIGDPCACLAFWTESRTGLLGSGLGQALGLFLAGVLGAVLTGALSLAAARLELRLGCASGAAGVCLVSLGDLGTREDLVEREWTSLMKGLAGDGALFSRFFSSCGPCALSELSITRRHEL